MRSWWARQDGTSRAGWIAGALLLALMVGLVTGLVPASVFDRMNWR